MKRIARSTYHKIYFLPALSLLLLSFLVFVATMPGPGSAHPGHPSSLAGVLFFAFLFWLVFGRRIAVHLIPLFISKIECPGCQEEIDVVGVWNCNCGFNDHKERNVLAKVCPKCGNRTGHLDCPRCSCTILLW